MQEDFNKVFDTLTFLCSEYTRSDRLPKLEGAHYEFYRMYGESIIALHNLLNNANKK